MTEELKDSGAVTAMSVVGLVFGIIGMLGSFIPCLGALAIYVAVPATIVSGIAVFIAMSQKAKKSLAIAALVISMIGTIFSGFQAAALMGAGKAISDQAKKDKLQQQNNLKTK